MDIRENADCVRSFVISVIAVTLHKWVLHRHSAASGTPAQRNDVTR